MARERRYTEMEERVRDTFETAMQEETLVALARCPRRSGLPAIGAYFCECPACTPELWDLDD